MLSWGAAGAPPNDNFANALPLTTASESVLDFDGPTTEPFEEELPSDNRNYPSVWFTWEAPAGGGWFDLRSNSAGFNIGYSVFTGNAPASLHLVADAEMSGYYWAFDSAPLFPSNGLRFQAAAGTAYRVRVYLFSSYGLVTPPTVGIFPASPPVARVVSMELPASAPFTGTETTVPVRLRIVSARKFEGGILSTLIGASTNDITATPFGADQRIAGDAFDGTYLIHPPVMCLFCTRYRSAAEDPEPMVWTVRDVMLATADWRTNLSQGSPGNMLWPEGTRNTVPLVNQLPEDMAAPEVVSLEVSPVDPTRNQYRARFHLRDAGFGFFYGSAALLSVDGYAYGFGVDLTRANLVEGTLRDGWYEALIDGSAAFPGRYAVEIRAADGAGNTVTVHSNAQDSPGPFRGEIAWRPQLVPQLLEFGVSSPVLDVSGGGASVTVTAVISDPGQPIEIAALSFSPQAGALYAGQVEFGTPTPLGDGPDRRYRFQRTLFVPQYSNPGRYLLTFSLKYAGLSELYFGARGIPPAGGTPSLEIVNPGIADNEAPGVEIISAEAVEPWSPVAMAGLKVRLRIHDNLQPLVDSSAPFGGTLVELTPTDAANSLQNGRRTRILPEHRISGDAMDGIYECLLRCASSGAVRLELTVRSNGTWSASLPGPVYVIPKVANPWQVWTDAWQLTGTDALPGADPDNDGRSNLEEYALGLAPVRGSPNATEGFPPPALRYYPQSGFYPEFFLYEFSAFVQPADAGVRIAPEFSTDFVNWLPAPAAPGFYSGWTIGSGYLTRTLSAGLPETSRSPRYFRLRVELLPP